MGTGPKANSGFDLNLTELEDYFLVEIGSEAGKMLISGLPIQPASAFFDPKRQSRSGRSTQADGACNAQSNRNSQCPAEQSGTPPLGCGSQTMLELHKLHPDLSNMLLLGCIRPTQPGWRTSNTNTGMGFLLQSRLFLYCRRQYSPEHPLQISPMADA